MPTDGSARRMKYNLIRSLQLHLLPVITTFEKVG